MVLLWCIVQFIAKVLIYIGADISIRNKAIRVQKDTTIRKAREVYINLEVAEKGIYSTRSYFTYINKEDASILLYNNDPLLDRDEFTEPEDVIRMDQINTTGLEQSQVNTDRVL